VRRLDAHLPFRSVCDPVSLLAVVELLPVVELLAVVEVCVFAQFAWLSRGA